MSIFNYKNYKNTSLVFTKPSPYYGSYEKIEIFYKDNTRKKKIILQTPPMFISFNVVDKDKNNSICISFSKKDVSKNVKLFYNFVCYLDKIIKNLCKTKRNTWLKKKKITYKPSISNYKNFSEFISINLPKKNGKYLFDIYDEQTKKVGIDKLTKNTEVSMIVELSNLYVGNKVMGCNWNVLQIKKYDTLSLDQCLIIDDEEIELPNEVPIAPIIPKNTKYEKYFKMLKMGIPLPAVKNNMIRDGNEISFVNGLPNDIDQFKLKLNSVPSKNNNKSLIPSISLLTNAKDLLKKADTNKHEKKVVKKDGFAPSLSDIKNILCKLKKPGQMEIKKNNETVGSVINLKELLSKKQKIDEQKNNESRRINLMDLLKHKKIEN